MKKKILDNKSLGGVLLSMSNIGLKFGKENGDGMHNRKRGKIGIMQTLIAEISDRIF